MKIKKFLSGRNMLEMLAVLAIVGVLTIGGLIAYKIAMTKHQTNELYKDLQLSSFSVYERTSLDGFEPGEAIPLPTTNGPYTISAHKATAAEAAANPEIEFVFEIENISRRVCREFLKRPIETPFSIIVNGEEFDPTSPQALKLCDQIPDEEGEGALLDLFVSKAHAAQSTAKTAKIVIPMSKTPPTSGVFFNAKDKTTGDGDDTNTDGDDDTAADDDDAPKKEEPCPNEGEVRVTAKGPNTTRSICCPQGHEAAWDQINGPVCCGEGQKAERVGGMNNGMTICCGIGKSAYGERVAECCDFVSDAGNGKSVCCNKGEESSSWDGKASCCGKGQDAVKVAGYSGEAYKCCPHGHQAYVSDAQTPECCGTLLYEKSNGKNGCCPQENTYWDNNARTTKCCEGGFYTDDNGQQTCCKETQEEGCCKGNKFNKKTQKCCGEQVIGIEECCEETEKCCAGKKLEEGYKCCHEEPIKEEECCNEYQNCCAGVEIPEDQKCCNGEPISVNECCWKLGERCCGKEPYPEEGTGRGCCGTVENGVTYDIKLEDCCGGEKIDVTTQRCCAGKPMGLFECCKEMGELCCGDTFFHPDDSTYICCYGSGGPETGKLHKNESGKKCCGNDFIDPMTQKCCNGELIGPEECCEAEGERCCGKKYFNPELMPDQGCCGNELYNAKEKGCCMETNQTYDLATQRCCNGKPASLDTTECCKEDPDCCGGEVINPQEKKCCFDKPIGVNDCCEEYQRCCNNVELMIDQRCCDNKPIGAYECCWEEGEACCGRDYYYPEAVESLGCCGEKDKGEVYDKTAYDCCEGKKINRNEQKCCRGKIIGINECCDEYESCCGEEFYIPGAMDGWECCGNGNNGEKYDINTEKCCNGKVVSINSTECCEEEPGTCCDGKRLPPDQKCCNGKPIGINECCSAIGERCCGKDYMPYEITPTYGCCSSTGNLDDGKLFNSEIQGCCNGQVFELEVAGCCGEGKNAVLFDAGSEGCCEQSGKKYTLGEEKCCAGEPIANNKCCEANGENCCGDLLIDPDTEGCCGYEKYDKATYDCCGDAIKGKKYDPVSQGCCPETAQLYDTSHQRCCAGYPLGMDECCEAEGEKCCNGVPLPDFLECCANKKAYDPLVKECCEETGETAIIGQQRCCAGKVIDKFACCEAYGDKCCGNQFYDPNTEGCCNSVPYKLAVNGHEYGCCGGSTYDTYAEGCCGNEKEGKTYTKDGSDKRCCEDNSAVEKDDCCPNEYVTDEKDVSACCNGSKIETVKYCSLNEMPDLECRPAANCCGGTTEIDLSTQKCCRGKPMAITECCDEYETCCGGTKIDPEKQDCCAGKPFNKTNSLGYKNACCGGQVYPENISGCCGNAEVGKTYTKVGAEKKCCTDNSAVDTDKCCPEDYVTVDIDRSECCDGTQMTPFRYCPFGQLPNLECEKAVGTCCPTEGTDCCGNVSYRIDVFNCCEDTKKLVDIKNGCCSDADCNNGRRCIDGVCKLDTGGCIDDGDCGENMECFYDSNPVGACRCKDYFAPAPGGKSCICTRHKECEEKGEKLNEKTCECVPDDAPGDDPGH